MKKNLLCALPFFLLAARLPAQQLNMLHAPDSLENVWVKSLYSDSLVSRFLIVGKQGVPVHYHRVHTETLYVLESQGQMGLGDSSSHIGPGRQLSIPCGTTHSVTTTGRIPLKILSIQAPSFDGNDRVWVEE